MIVRGVLVGVAVFGGALACGPSAHAAEGSEAEGRVSEEKTLIGSFCGGFAAIPCPEGLACVDDPRDDCDPNRGGADCGGVCRKDPPRPDACAHPHPGLDYVSQDPEQCLAITFSCAEGAQRFFNPCGCGCRDTGRRCNDNNPNREYISQDPELCAAIRFFCESGYQPFFDACGCGCERAP
jgi:hypothetical protein